MTGLLLLASALAGELSAGVQVGVGRDLPSLAAQDPTTFGLGPAALVSARWAPAPGAAVRVGLELARGTGTDRLLWSETVNGERYDFYAEDQVARFSSARLVVGPELAVLPDALVTPVLGAGAGVGVVTGGHELGAQGAALAEGDAGPSTRQLTWAAGGWLGLRAGRPGKVALELEAGYLSSFLPEAPLRNAPSALEASRAAWSLDLVRVSGGVSFPL